MYKPQNLRLRDEQTVNGLRNIAWASIFRFNLSPCLNVSGILETGKMELMEKQLAFLLQTGNGMANFC
jgi:hypothetical protein